MLAIDVFEQWNHVTDWNQVKRDGVGAVWVKVTDGGGVASVPPDHYVNSAKAAGLPVGGYHFAEGTPQPEIQAEVFLSELVRLNAFEVAPALDLEVPGIADPESFRVRFWEHFRARSDVSPVLTYASESWFQSKLVDAPVIAGEEIWAARYGSNDGTDQGESLADWDVHQFTSMGVLAGIDGRIDLDNVKTNVFTNRGDDMPLATKFEIDPVKGRAYASFEVGGNSQVIKELWVAAKSLYGEIPNALMVFEDDNGNQVGTSETVTFEGNKRVVRKAPDSASDVTIEWDPTKSTGLLSPYLVWK